MVLFILINHSMGAGSLELMTSYRDGITADP